METITGIPESQFSSILMPITERSSTLDSIVTPQYAIYLCDYCPHMFLTETSLKEHVELTHKLMKPSEISELQCPGCINIFFHTTSLESHLINDHCIKQEDVEKIMPSVLDSKKCVTFSKRDHSILENLAKIEEIDILQPIVQETESTSEALLLYDEFIKDDSSPGESVTEANLIKLKQGESNNNINDLITNDMAFLDTHEESINVKDTSQEKEISNDSNEIMFINYDEEDSDIISPVPSHPPQKIKTNTSKSVSTYVESQIEYLNHYFSNKQTYRCSIEKCRTKLESVKNLEYHIKCHSEGKFMCPECKEPSLRWGNIAGHLWRSHKIDIGLHKCDLCDYRTHSYMKLYNQHRMIHGEERPFKCDFNYCNKTFKTLKQMRSHKYRFHKDGDPLIINSLFSCSNCEKSFTTKRLLKDHMSVHLKIKPYTCSSCDFAAKTKGALRLHNRIHTGEKPYKCDLCEYSTADHNSIRRHKLRHSGDKPYKCLYCDYQSIQSSTFKTHIKVQHPGLEEQLVFACLHCPFRSVNKDVYNTHLILNHQDLNNVQIDSQ